MARIVGIDDETLVRTLLEEVILEQGQEAVMAGTLAEGMNCCRQEPPDVVFLDLLLPDGNGIEVIRQLRSLPGQPEVIVITGHGSPEDAKIAIRNGVAAYLAKPLNQKKISLSLHRALAFRAQRQEALRKRGFARPGIIGASPALNACLETAAEAAGGEVSVLITGETGTGKELFARAIHENSARARKAFVTVDCASLSETLVSSQLFGHTRGAYTGADRDRKGLVAQAHTGTLFLDEVGEMPLPVQRSFLRVLEEHAFRPLGAAQEEKSDFRVIAATNRDLDEMVRLGLFRSDLLYRLRGLQIHLPPLRERDGDLQRLSTYFLDSHCLRGGQCGKNVSSDFLETIQAYDWPGNVRELSHAIARALTVLGEELTLFANHLPLGIRVQAARNELEQAQNAPAESSPPPMNHATTKQELPSLKDFKLQMEARYLKQLMDRTDGDVRQAALTAGVSRGHLYELLKKHDIDKG